MKRRIVLVVSLAFGLLAAVLTRLYVGAKEAEVDELKAAIKARYGEIWVLSFARDVPAGSVLERSDFMLCKVPKVGLQGQALTQESVNDVVGRKLLLGHRAKEILFWSDVEGGNPAAKGLSADIKRQMRAVSINCSGAAAVSGMLRPNDHVDVIGTFEFDSTPGRRNFVTSTILQNVLVLATGSRTSKTPEQQENSGAAYTTVTLEVSPREAEMLAFAEQIRGRLVLSLRNRNDTSFEKELPQVDYEKIRGEIEALNLQRQTQKYMNH